MHSTDHVWTDALKWLILAIVATAFTVTYLLTHSLTNLIPILNVVK